MRFNRANLNRLFQYAYALTGEREQAADLVQDTLEKLLRRGRMAPPADSPLAFAKRTLRNVFYDHCRHNAVIERHQRQPTVEMDGQRSLEDMVIDQDQLAHIWSRLQPQERELLYLWAVEGRTIAEIADHLEIPKGTLLSRVHRLRQRLQSEPRHDAREER